MIIDGLADEPVPSLGNVTPLTAAHTPWLDRLAATGTTGRWQPTPHGRAPGSEVGLFSCLGEAAPQVGRGALEALGKGIDVGPGERVFRLSAVTLSGPPDRVDTVPLDEIPVPDAAWDVVARHWPEARCFPDRRGRHLLVLPQGEGGMMPPHQAIGLPLFAAGTLPNGMPWRTMQERLGVALWPWGGGPAPQPVNRLTGWSMVAGVDLAYGVGRSLGITPAPVSGATGDVDTNLSAKVRRALALLAEGHSVVVHVEGADMAAHRRDPRAKRGVIERLDRELIGPLMRWGGRLAVTCDHGTSSVTGRHLAGPVPFALSDAGHGGAFDEMANGPVGSVVDWQRHLLETPVRC